MKIKLTILLLGLFLVSFTTSGQSKPSTSEENKKIFSKNIKPENEDDTIYAMIYALPEVKEQAKSIEEESKSNGHLRIEITERPKENDGKYYWVQTGVIDDFRFTPFSNFIVSPTNFEIKYYNTITDSIITLESWRRKIKINCQH